MDIPLEIKHERKVVLSKLSLSLSWPFLFVPIPCVNCGRGECSPRGDSYYWGLQFRKTDAAGRVLLTTDV